MKCMLYELQLPKMAVFFLFVCLFFKIRKHSGCRRRRKWQPTPVFLPGESQGRRSLVGCCLWGRTESDMTEATQQQQQVAVALSLGRGQKADSGSETGAGVASPPPPRPRPLQALRRLEFGVPLSCLQVTAPCPYLFGHLG